MRYISTRGGGTARPFLDILLEGLAPDGGLYVPENYPALSAGELKRMRAMTYPELAFTVLAKFIDDVPAADLRTMVNATYTKDIFGSEDIIPIKKLEDDLYLLDLSEGPTLAFKDVALQFLGRLFEYVLAKKGETLNILGATSGDTGSAAEYAMRGRTGVNVFMLSPLGRMSEFQRRQMYTLADTNIFNIAVRGTFDDCQDAVKAVNEDADFKRRYKIGAVNSINWARVAAQVVYYFWGYFRSTELTTGRSTELTASRATASNDEKIAFAVPTGNFGNILSGLIARRMGLPIGQFVLATNENNVLEEFFRTGTYRPRTGNEVHATSSPSMDISKASNFERYVFDLVERDAKRMGELWGDLKKNGAFSLSKEEFERLQKEGIVAGASTHADRVHTIKTMFEKYGVIIDPHTADAVASGLKLRMKGMPLICLETAQAAKFSATIKEAIGLEAAVPPGYAEIAGMNERFKVFEPDPAAIKKYIAASV